MIQTGSTIWRRLMGLLRRSFLMMGGVCFLATNAAFAAKDAAPPVLLAAVYGDHIDPSLYLVSEKFDGVRALWDGKQLRFRSGRVIAAPSWFTARLPSTPLDGELWLGRGRFDVLSGIVRSEVPNDADWKQVIYLVFELPSGTGTFTERAAQLRALVQRSAWPQLQAVTQELVSNRADLQRRLDQIMARGGEGLVLHLASSAVTSGRSEVLLKMKPHQDTEATVIGHRAGQGKYAGQVGALQMQTPQGQRFYLGSGLSDDDRRNPPALGTVVTYRYRELTPQGVPRFATFLRVHHGV
jgi:DNA ligase 1